MAPHDEDRSAPHDDDLSSLYQQRKRRHPAPERLNQAVLDTAKAEKKAHGHGVGWKGALTSAAAAVVIVVLGVNWLDDPMQPIGEDLSVQSGVEVPKLAGSDQPMQAETTASDAIAQPAKQSAAPAPRAEAGRSEIAEPEVAEERAFESEPPAMMADQTTAFSSSTFEATQAEPEQPRFLKVIAGNNTEFEQCDGEVFTGEIAAAPQSGWFELTWSEEGRVSEVTPLGTESPCSHP